MMKFIVNQKVGAGVLYKEKDIICIKNRENYLEVYELFPAFKNLLTIKLSERTNRVGKYPEGVYYFQNRNTFFHTFKEGGNRIVEGSFFYKVGPEYCAYTLLNKKDLIVCESDKLVEIPILQHGGQKLFLDKSLVQVGQKNELIAYYDVLQDNISVWQQTFTDLTESESANLNSQILNSEDKLFFVVTGNGRKGLFVLDIRTGQVLKKFEGLSHEIFKDEEYIYTTSFENILCRINIKTLELEEWDCNTLIKENNFESIHDHRCDVVDGKFCFTQSLGDNKAKLGVLDWRVKELVYQYDFEPKNGAIGSIQVSSTRMFASTQDNTLHIFQKELESIL